MSLQEKPVVVKHLVATGTLEEKMMELSSMRRKQMGNSLSTVTDVEAGALDKDVPVFRLKV